MDATTIAVVGALVLAGSALLLRRRIRITISWRGVLIEIRPPANPA